MESREIVARLLDPRVYPHPAPDVSLIQTHISYVLLAGDYVYKIKKPVNLGFLDYTSLAARRHYCQREVAINRRLAPGVYLGVSRITEDGGCLRVNGTGRTLEYAVRMRRLPNSRLLSEMLPSGEVTPAMIEALALQLERFHRRSPAGPAIAVYGSLKAIRRNWIENFRQIAAWTDVSLPEHEAGALLRSLRQYLRFQRHLLEGRISEGRIRDCHGDLRAEHICFLDQQILVFDRIEFNQRFRYGDVASDIAFLAMDLESAGRPSLARKLVSTYVQRSRDWGLPFILDFYKCYRAFVRGKVESFKMSDAEIPVGDRAKALEMARHHFDLAASYARRSLRPFLLITCGLVGTGKSTLAQAMAAKLGIAYISSDVVRKELAGLAATMPQVVPFESGIYTPEFSRRTYQGLFRRAAEELARGGSVILDAGFRETWEREQALRLAEKLDTRFLLLECWAPPTLVQRRLRQRARQQSTSDGRWEIYQREREAYRRPLEMPRTLRLRVDMRRSVDAALDDILLDVAQRLFL